jgi:hypothetical protein
MFNSSPASKKTFCLSVTENSVFMFRKEIAASSGEQTKSTILGLNVELMKQGAGTAKTFTAL